MAFTAEIPMDMPNCDGYFIYRDTQPGQPFDPASPPVFFPPKDSDELFDALRAKYPHTKTHSERMRDAIIEFLLNEREAEQMQASTSPAASFNEGAATTPWQAPSWPSMVPSGTTSSFSSPDTLDLATPSFGMSPFPHSVQPNRHPSMAASTTTTSPSMTENAPGLSPPALEQMTGVFSISSTDQPKQRVRRKMTEAEKIDYRKRRMIKACEKCQKRKRKCNHNQGAMDTLGKRSKAKKSDPGANVKHKPTTPPTPMVPPPAPTGFSNNDFDEKFDFDEFLTSDMTLFDDVVDWDNFLHMPSAHMPQQGFDRSKHFNDDFLLQGPLLNTEAHQNSLFPTDYRRQGQQAKAAGARNAPHAQQQWNKDESSHDHELPPPEASGNHGYMRGFYQSTGGSNIQCSTPMNEANTHEALKFDQILTRHSGAALLSTRSSQNDQPTHTRHVHEAALQGSPYVFDIHGPPDLPLRRAGASTPLLRSESVIDRELPSTSAVRSSSSSAPAEESATVKEGRKPDSNPALGEVGDRASSSSSSSSAQLFMSRRRLSRYLGSKNPAVTHEKMDSPSPLLQTIAEGSSSAVLTGDGLPLALRANRTQAQPGTPDRRSETTSSHPAFPTVLASSASGGCDQHAASPTGADAAPARGTAHAIHSSQTPAVVAQEAVLPDPVRRKDRSCAMHATGILATGATGAPVQEDRLPDHVRRRDHFGRSATASVRVASSVRPSGITLWSEVGVSLVLAGVLLVGLFAAVVTSTIMMKGVEETGVSFFALAMALMSVVGSYGGSTGFSSQLIGAKRLLESGMVRKYSSKLDRTGLARFCRCGEGGSWRGSGLKGLM
ncbi:hypothetical protein KC332_g10052 [Hortaea werneckii]|nr:hypothetical protein KC358_g3071 [Hortaea werneckii]KAI6851183.1 hypothetical protein KC350_g1746 [Hortaea werneckii]KAI6942055.1 hypothetical protein KC341_g2502 [Hortaea werneckii]KAI6946464.1 hypothetical protein KC348_g3125 [Hortaea werneckii]KAI6969738.1 hypothetical protein KC321_g7715 [Hortaea werneckii]